MDLSKHKLIGKIVVNEEGVFIGRIEKSLKNTKSGEVKSFLIEPSKEIDIAKYKQNRQGRIILPSDCISPVQDVIIFEKNLLYETD